MRVSLDISHVKEGTENLWYTTCAIEFTNEERAIIRERSLYEHKIVFRNGFVNYTPPPKRVDPRTTSGFALMIFVFSLPMMYFAPPLALLAWIAAPSIYIYGKIKGAQMPVVPRTGITLDEVLASPSFTVCAFNDPLNSSMLEHDIREQLEGIKALIAYSGKPVTSKSFEL